MARPRFTIPVVCIPSVQLVSLAAWTVRLAITTARLRPRTIRARMLRLGMLTTTATAWAMRVTAKLRARNQRVMWPTAPTCAMTRRLATTTTATMAHVSRWMRWAYAVVRALRMPIMMACATMWIRAWAQLTLAMFAMVRVRFTIAVAAASLLVIAIATATSWMRWACAVVRAQRIPTATVCVTPTRWWVARTAQLATTILLRRMQVLARTQIRVTIATGHA